MEIVINLGLSSVEGFEGSAFGEKNRGGGGKEL